MAAAWIAVLGLVALKRRRVDWGREAKLLLVFICLIVIARIVYFPLQRVNEMLGVLRFNSAKMPGIVNLAPLKCFKIKYKGWLINIIGNIAMFIPVGIVWPVCFKKLNNIGKATLAGFTLSLVIELTQLLFYERASDVDDLMLNTLGALIGAALYFGIKRLVDKRRGRGEKKREERAKNI